MTQAQSDTAFSAGDDGQNGGDAHETPSAASDPAPSSGETSGADGNAHSLPGASADIAFTALLAEDLSGSLGDYEGSLFAPPQDYDGHVALALDSGILPNIDTALDLLTSSPHLFDVPVVDLAAGGDDVSIT